MFYCIILAVSSAFLGALWRLGFERRVIATFAIALMLLLSCLLNSAAWINFSSDYALHQEYTAYIAEHDRLPPLSLNDGARHPPTYYIAGAAMLKLGHWAGDRADPFDYPLIVSLALMCVFWVFGALTLRRLLPSGGTAYFCAILLFAFWPAGLYKANVLNCDVLTYPALAAFMYSMVGWLQTRKAAWLEGACYAVAMHLLAKNSGLVPLVFLVACFGINHLLFKNGLKETFRPRMLIAILFLVWSCASTMLRDRLDNVTPEHAVRHLDFATFFDRLLYFSPYQFIAETMYAPYGEFSLPHFLHYFLRSLLVGGSIRWTPHVILVVYGIVWLGMMLYVVYGIWRIRKQIKIGNGIWLFLTLLCGALIAMMMSRFVGYSKPTLFADARYVYPIIIPIIACYCGIIAQHQRQGNRLAAQIGSGGTYGFALLSFTLFFLQNLG